MVILVGGSLLAIFTGASLGRLLFIELAFAIFTAVGGAFFLGFSILLLTRAAARLAADYKESYTQIGFPWPANRSGAAATALCFVYGLIGLFVLPLPFLFPSEFTVPSLEAALGLWLGASATLLLAAWIGTDFLDKLFPLMGVGDEPHSGVLAFAGLMTFSTLVLLSSLVVLSGGIVVVVIVFPFVVSPLYGIRAFVRLFSFGRRLIEIQDKAVVPGVRVQP